MKPTMDEWHAFVIGFGQALWFWKNEQMPSEYDNPLKREYHYYVAGAATAILFVFAVIIGVIWFFGR